MNSRRAFAPVYVLCGLALLLSGCPSVTDLPHTVVAPTGQATAAQLAAQQATIDELKAKDATSGKLAQTASGGVWAAKDANAHNPDGLPKEAVDAQLTEAASALPEPTAEQKLEKANQNARILAGELAAVKAEMGQKISENQALKAAKAESDQRITELLKKVDETKAAGEKERTEQAAKYQKELDSKDQAIAGKNKEIEDLKNAWTRNTQLWAARGLVAVGILVVVAGAAIVWISGLSAIGKAGGIALSGLLLIASGLIVGHRYFLPVAGSALGIGLLAGAWYIWHIRRTHQITQGVLAAVQDVKDAAAAGSEKAKVAAEELKENLVYRFPRTPDGNASGIEKEIDRRLVVGGLNAPPTPKTV